MSFCTKQNRTVSYDECTACFVSQSGLALRAKYGRAMRCRDEHIRPAEFEEIPEIDLTPAERLVDAARLAREYVYHRGGHTAEAREIVRYLDEALRAVNELELVS